MRIQDLIVRQTQRALDDVLRAIEALPEDKRDWKPGEGARSALDQLREMAWAPRFYMPYLGSGEAGAGHEEIRAKAREEVSYEVGRDLALKATGELCAMIANVPDDRLEDEVTLPMGGGMVMTLAEVLGIHYWNLVYHQGQINYIQTLLGDREMH